MRSSQLRSIHHGLDGARYNRFGNGPSSVEVASLEAESLLEYVLRECSIGRLTNGPCNIAWLIGLTLFGLLLDFGRGHRNHLDGLDELPPWRVRLLPLVLLGWNPLLVSLVLQDVHHALLAPSLIDIVRFQGLLRHLVLMLRIRYHGWVDAIGTGKHVTYVDWGLNLFIFVDCWRWSFCSSNIHTLIWVIFTHFISIKIGRYYNIIREN
jgi:hypothetical protein